MANISYGKSLQMYQTVHIGLRKITSCNKTDGTRNIMSATHKLIWKHNYARMFAPSLCVLLLMALSQVTHAQEPNLKNENNSNPEREKIQIFIAAPGLQSSFAWPNSWRSNSSVITQVGNGNQARVDQRRDRTNFDYGNNAKIYQNGNYNEANIIQSGGNNIGLIGQIGNGHQATIEQSGNSFEAQVNQYGYQSEINISQSGSAQRSISVSQRANSGATAPVTIRTN